MVLIKLYVYKKAKNLTWLLVFSMEHIFKTNPISVGFVLKNPTDLILRAPDKLKVRGCQNVNNCSNLIKFSN